MRGNRITVELIGGPHDGMMIEVPSKETKIMTQGGHKYHRRSPFAITATWKHLSKTIKREEER